MRHDLSILQLRYTKAQFAASNPTPSSGQLCIETDSGTTKVGDGYSAYSALTNSTLSGEERTSADDVWASRGSGNIPAGETTIVASQANTANPIPTVLENATGVTPVMSRAAKGQYRLSMPGVFRVGKFAVVVQQPTNDPTIAVTWSRIDDDTIYVLSYSDSATSSLGDSILLDCIIMIRSIA